MSYDRIQAVPRELGSTDAAPEVPHPRPTRRRAGDGAARVSGRVMPCGFHRRVPTRADTASTRANAS